MEGEVGRTGEQMEVRLMSWLWNVTMEGGDAERRSVET